MKKLSHILLIDDDKITNFITEKLLRKMKISEEIRVALNGKEALELIKERCKNNLCCPDLILLDINMPVMDGFEFLHQFHNSDLKNSQASNVVMLTTSTSPRDIEALKERGIHHLINKPVTEEKMIKVLEKVS